MKNFIVGALIIGVAIVVGFWIAQPIVQYGASSGPTHYNMEYFYGGLVQGGVKTTLSTASGATTTLTAAQICDSALVEWTPSIANSSTTFPTSATVVSQCLAKDGDTKTFLLRNIGSAASTTVVAAGTGMILLEPDGQNVVIAGGNVALVTMVRASSTAVIVNIDELIDAD